MSRSRRSIVAARPPASVEILRTIARVLLAAALTTAGAGHLFWLRRGFRIAVPEWTTKLLRTDKDMIVVSSGAAEIMLGAALLVLPKERRRIGAFVAAFFVAVLPGNVHQWQTGRPSPGMRTDRARFVRLFLQPVLVVWTLWATATPRGGR